MSMNPRYHHHPNHLLHRCQSSFDHNRYHPPILLRPLLRIRFQRQDLPYFHHPHRLFYLHPCLRR